MNMIEKVARAINEAGFKLSGNLNVLQFENMSHDSQLLCVGLAQAAIEAMKEPTEEMKNLLSAKEPLGYTPSERWDRVKPYWEAAIEAALKDG